MKGKVNEGVRKEMKGIRAHLAYILGVRRSDVKLHVSGDEIIAADVCGQTYFMDLFNI